MRIQVVPTILRARTSYQSAFETGRSVEEFDPSIEAGREVAELWTFLDRFIFGRTAVAAPVTCAAPNDGTRA
jgi:hypothetical protein